jgi:hypothetical protein
MAYIDPADVHYRLVTARDNASNVSVVCVQDFDYYDYGDRFITEQLFATEEDAQWVADRINKRPWKIKQHHSDLADVLMQAAYAIEEENPLMDRATDVSGWMRDRARKIRWGLL